MRRRIPIVAMVAGLALAATACGGGDTTPAADEPSAAPEPTTEESEPVAAPEPSAEGSEAPIERADADLVIWTDDTRAPIVQEIGDAFGEENDLTVAVQQLDFGTIRENLITRGPVGEGPDIEIIEDHRGVIVLGRSCVADDRRGMRPPQAVILQTERPQCR